MKEALRTMNLLWRMILVHLRATRLLRRDGNLSLTGVSVIKLTTLPTDIDILRHMNNGRYLSLADLGRWDLVVRIGVFARTQQLGWIPVLSQASATFRKPLVVGQRFELQTRMIGTDDRAVVMEQRFVRDEEIHMRLITRTRFVKRAGGIVTIDELHEQFGTIPDEVPDWVHGWADASRLASTKQQLPSDWT
ncbi:thioesterase family protein [Micropruina sp.]|uniref:thioesterase family protein n=1 Tax=Micropruina sp. TaxID=2737536 RepID=UPI0039E3BDF6